MSYEITLRFETPSVLKLWKEWIYSHQRTLLSNLVMLLRHAMVSDAKPLIL